MKNRNRSIQIKFYVNDKELEQINNRFHSVNLTNRGAYLRKMAIDGYIVNVDTSDIKAVVKEMNAIGKNINQITRNANTYGIAEQDIKAIKARVDEIWQLLKFTRIAKKSDSQRLLLRSKSAERVKHSLGKSIEYIGNNLKTENGEYISTRTAKKGGQRS